MAWYIQIGTRMKFLSDVGIVLVCLNILTLVGLFFKDGDQSSSIEWKITGLFFNFMMLFFGANASSAFETFFSGPHPVPDRLKMPIRSLVLAVWIVVTYSELLWLQISSSKRPSTLDAESQRSPEFLHVKSQCYLQKSPLFNPWHLVFGCFLIGKYTNSEK